MTSPDRLAELDQLKSEFYNEATTDERRREILQRVQVFAMAEVPDSICTTCKKCVISIGWTRPLVEGHIYTHEGESEYRITRMCEYCFDKLMLPIDDTRRREWFGLPVYELVEVEGEEHWVEVK